MSSETRSVKQHTMLYRLRKGFLAVHNVEEFRAGLVCGQATRADKHGKVSDEDLFTLFEDLLGDQEKSQTYMVGCLIGMVDALLQPCKTLPPEYEALLLPLKTELCKEGERDGERNRSSARATTH